MTHCTQRGKAPGLAWAGGIAIGALLAGACAGVGNPAGDALLLQPTTAQLRRIIAADLARDPRFDSFEASSDLAARKVASAFSPELAGVRKLGCHAASSAQVDCLVEVVLRFPGLDGRESRVVWERRLKLIDDGWQSVGFR